MGTEYYGKICRKKDDFEIAEIYCNELKVIYNTHYEIPNKIEISDLISLETSTKNEIAQTFSDISHIELKTLVCKNKEIKEEFEQDILDKKESLDTDFGLWEKYTCIIRLIGKILGVACDMFDKDKKQYGYTYNAIKDKDGYGFLDESDLYLKVDKSY